jgi:hypothetical protein
MEREDRKILGAIQILRKVTKTVKIAPFVLAVLYMLSMIGYMVFSDTVATILDYLFYISPSTIVILLMLSKSTKMCVWHRLECVLPMVSMLPALFDDLIIEMTNVAAYINVSTVALIFLASLLNAYFVFIKPRNEESNS